MIDVRSLVNRYIHNYPELYEDEELYEIVIDFVKELLEGFMSLE